MYTRERQITFQSFSLDATWSDRVQRILAGIIIVLAVVRLLHARLIFLQGETFVILSLLFFILPSHLEAAASLVFTARIYSFYTSSPP